MAIAGIERHECQAGFDLGLHRRIRFQVDTLAQQRGARFVERAQHFLHGGEPHRALSVREVEPRHGNLQLSSQPVVRPNFDQIIPAAGTGRFQRDGIDEIERLEAVVRRLDDEDLLVADAKVQTVVEKRGEHRPCARMAAFAQTFDKPLLVGEAGFAQLHQGGEKAVVPGLGARGSGEDQSRQQQGTQSSRAQTISVPAGSMAVRPGPIVERRCRYL